MPTYIDQTGKTFGRLTVIERSFPENLSPKMTYFRCVCECGVETISTSANLKSGKSTSCGCLRIERTKEANKGNQHRYESYVGRVFGYLTVLFRTEKRPRAWYMCECVCGTQKEFSGKLLIAGDAKSCGCKTKEMASAALTKHGMSGNNADRKPDPTYVSYKTMVQRGTNPNAKGSEHYFLKGVRVCDRWLGPYGFKNFLEDMGIRPEGCTLERSDLDGDYTPENTFWADSSVQARNRSNNRFYTLNGLTLCVTDWAVKIGIHPSSLYRRIEKLGWPLELALTLPPTAKVEQDPLNGRWKRVC